jgi:hypothetical protein
VHRALAAMVAELDADRRAWHRVAAGPDEEAGPRDARGHLQIADEMLQALGASAFAARAAAELWATGERPRKRTAAVSRALTAQEARIVRLVSAARATATSPRSYSSAPAPSTTTCGRYSGSSASPRVPSWFALCLMAALRTRNF